MKELEALDLEKIKNRTCLPLNTNCYIVTEKEFGVLEQALIQTEADKKKAEAWDIVKEHPFILQKIFETKGLKNQADYDKRYFWSTINEEQVQKVMEELK